MNKNKTSNEEGVKSQMEGKSEREHRRMRGGVLDSEDTVLECGGLVFFQW